MLAVPFGHEAAGDVGKLMGISAANQLSLSEIVYRELHNAILNGVYLPGEAKLKSTMALRLGSTTCTPFPCQRGCSSRITGAESA